MCTSRDSNEIERDTARDTAFNVMLQSFARDIGSASADM